MVLYAIVRMDWMFYESGVQGPYMAASAGLRSAFDRGVYKGQIQIQQDGVLRMYSEEELFEPPGQYLILSSHDKLCDTRKWPIEVTRTAGGPKSDLSHLLPVFSNCVDQKNQKCLSRGTVKRREEPLESRASLVTTIKPSSLSRTSECLSAYSPATLQTAKTTSGGDKVANKVEPDADNDVSSTSTVMRASFVRELESSYQLVSNQVEDMLVRNVNTIQEQLVYLRKGESAKYLFDMNGLLRVRVPGLHLSLESDTLSAGNGDADETMTSQMQQAQQRPLQIELEWLSSMPCTEVGLAQIVDLQDEWAEKSTPEGVLFSTEGLLLKKRSTFLRLRARWD